MDYKVVTVTGEDIAKVASDLEKEVTNKIAKGYKPIGEAKVVVYKVASNYEKFAMLQTIIKE